MSLLEIENLQAAYGQVQVLHGIGLSVDVGEVVVLLGGNGAGKTTTLRSICQMEGVHTSGIIDLEGQSLRGLRTEVIAGRGVAHVPQGRGTFPELTVEENLHVGAYLRRDKGIEDDVARWYDTFPRLGERRDQRAGTLSGGEQQMLAVARALMGHPKVLLLDEPSLGLAPMVIQNLFALFGDLNKEHGTTMLIVEQNATLALSIATRAYVLETGSIVLSGSADELQNDDAVRRAYLGFEEAS